MISLRHICGFFDNEQIVRAISAVLADNKGISLSLDSLTDYKEFKEKEYDRLADTLRASMDMDMIYSIMGLNR